MAFLAWRSFKNYIVTKMTEAPVTYATFYVVFIHGDATVLSLYRLVRDFCRHRGPGSKWAAVFMPLSIIFILVFPTFVNAMSGYMTANDPYVEDRSGTMIPFYELKQVAYIIHDGDRINATDDWVIPFVHESMP